MNLKGIVTALDALILYESYYIILAFIKSLSSNYVPIYSVKGQKLPSVIDCLQFSHIVFLLKYRRDKSWLFKNR